MDAKQIAELQALAGMTDAQKAHYGKLGGDAKEAFAKADGAGRASLMTAGAGDDPIVYTSKADGSVYRKSDDPRAIAIAKREDARDEAAKIEKEARLEIEALALAKSWDHMPGTIEEKTVKARGILSLSPTDPARVTALEAIAAHKAAIAPLFQSLGARDGQPTMKGEKVDAEEKLNKLASDLAASQNISQPDALVKVLATTEGARLYSKINSRGNAPIH